MALKRYSINESLRRLVRIFRGEILEDDRVTLYENEAGWDESLSDIAELMQNSYPGYVPQLPGYVLIGTGSFTSAHNTLHNNSFIEETLVFTQYDAEPARSAASDIHGGINSLATGESISSGTPVNFSKGIGKFILVLNAGSDSSGTINVSGTSINRNSGVSTSNDSESLTIAGLSADGTTTDSNGNNKYYLSGTYITSKWFEGAVGLYTDDVDLSDFDIYHISFEQFNDSSNITLETFDVNLLCTNVAAEFDGYLYTVQVSGGRALIDLVAQLHVGADGFTAIANTYNRLRRGNLDIALDGTTDGIWASLHYSNSPAYVEDVTTKVWAKKITDLTL